MLGLIAAGIYFAVFRRPSPESLLAQIEPKVNDPVAVQEQLEQFVKWYPDHPRIEEIEELRRIADAVRLRNTFSLRTRVRGLEVLNSLERQFYELTDFDSPTDFTKLQALITLTESSGQLDPASTRILHASRAYLRKFQREASRHTAQERQKIEAAFDTAAQSEPEQAQAIYRSVVEMYKDHPWAQDLVEFAQRQIQNPPPR